MYSLFHHTPYLRILVVLFTFHSSSPSLIFPLQTPPLLLLYSITSADFFYFRCSFLFLLGTPLGFFPRRSHRLHTPTTSEEQALCSLVFTPLVMVMWDFLAEAHAPSPRILDLRTESGINHSIPFCPPSFHPSYAPLVSPVRMNSSHEATSIFSLVSLSSPIPPSSSPVLSCQSSSLDPVHICLAHVSLSLICPSTQ